MPIDKDTDLQLHPLRESTWDKIFPILSLFKKEEVLEDNGEANQPRNSQGGELGAKDMPIR